MALEGRVSPVNMVLSLYPRVQDPYFEMIDLPGCAKDSLRGEGCSSGVTCRAYTRLTTTCWV